MLTRRNLLTAPAVGLALNSIGVVPHGFTQDSTKIARIIVGFPPGGTSDVIARLLASAMKDYASSIIVETRSGAGGRVAIEALKTAGLFNALYRSSYCLAI
jgi:tripartite-type tricarboxylate transporter receptor subunit TctC